MKDILSLYDLLLRNQLFSLLKTFMSYILVISISSFIYESVYHEYELIDVTNYRDVYSFLVKGRFAVPLSLFLIVWFMTYLFSEVFFTLINWKLSERVKKFLFARQWIVPGEQNKTQGTTDKSLSKTNLVTEVSKKWYLIPYMHFRNTTSKEQKENLLQKFRRTERQTGSDFTLIVRITCAVSIYFFTQPEFGCLLYLFVILVLIIYALVTIVLHQLATHIPAAIRKLETEMAPYLVDGEMPE